MGNETKRKLVSCIFVNIVSIQSIFVTYSRAQWLVLIHYNIYIIFISDTDVILRW